MMNLGNMSGATCAKCKKEIGSDEYGTDPWTIVDGKLVHTHCAELEE